MLPKKHRNKPSKNPDALTPWRSGKAIAESYVEGSKALQAAAPTNRFSLLKSNTGTPNRSPGGWEETQSTTHSSGSEQTSANVGSVQSSAKSKKPYNLGSKPGWNGAPPDHVARKPAQKHENYLTKMAHNQLPHNDGSAQSLCVTPENLVITGSADLDVSQEHREFNDQKTPLRRYEDYRIGPDTPREERQVAPHTPRPAVRTIQLLKVIQRAHEEARACISNPQSLEEVVKVNEQHIPIPTLLDIMGGAGTPSPQTAQRIQRERKKILKKIHDPSSDIARSLGGFYKRGGEFVGLPATEASKIKHDTIIRDAKGTGKSSLETGFLLAQAVAESASEGRRVKTPEVTMTFLGMREACMKNTDSPLKAYVTPVAPRSRSLVSKSIAPEELGQRFKAAHTYESNDKAGPKSLVKDTTHYLLTTLTDGTQITEAIKIYMVNLLMELAESNPAEVREVTENYVYRDGFAELLQLYPTPFEKIYTALYPHQADLDGATKRLEFGSPEGDTDRTTKEQKKITDEEASNRKAELEQAGMRKEYEDSAQSFEFRNFIDENTKYDAVINNAKALKALRTKELTNRLKISAREERHHLLHQHAPEEYKKKVQQQNKITDVEATARLDLLYRAEDAQWLLIESHEPIKALEIQELVERSAALEAGPKAVVHTPSEELTSTQISTILTNFVNGAAISVAANVGTKIGQYVIETSADTLGLSDDIKLPASYFSGVLGGGFLSSLTSAQLLTLCAAHPLMCGAIVLEVAGIYAALNYYYNGVPVIDSIDSIYDLGKLTPGATTLIFDKYSIIATPAVNAVTDLYNGKGAVEVAQNALVNGVASCASYFSGSFASSFAHNHFGQSFARYVASQFSYDAAKWFMNYAPQLSYDAIQLIIRSTSSSNPASSSATTNDNQDTLSDEGLPNFNNSTIYIDYSQHFSYNSWEINYGFDYNLERMKNVDSVVDVIVAAATAVNTLAMQNTHEVIDNGTNSSATYSVATLPTFLLESKYEWIGNETNQNLNASTSAICTIANKSDVQLPINDHNAYINNQSSELIMQDSVCMSGSKGEWIWNETTQNLNIVTSAVCTMGSKDEWAANEAVHDNNIVEASKNSTDLSSIQPIDDASAEKAKTLAEAQLSYIAGILSKAHEHFTYYNNALKHIDKQCAIDIAICTKSITEKYNELSVTLKGADSTLKHIEDAETACVNSTLEECQATITRSISYDWGF